MKEFVVDCALVAGVGCLTYGAYQCHPIGGWLVAGAALLVAGALGVRAIALEKREKK